MEAQFTLRLPKKLNDKVKSEAKTERRSKNDQIIRILEERYGVAALASPKSTAQAEPVAA